jgi:hypothetical protein
MFHSVGIIGFEGFNDQGDGYTSSGVVYNTNAGPKGNQQVATPY